MKNKLIILVGNVGTGKSTLTKMLADKLPAANIESDLFDKNPFLPMAVKDRQRWSLASDLWFLKERVKIAQEFDTYLERSHVVVDSGLPMSQVYTHSRLGHGFFIKEEWDLYQECYDAFTRDLTKPDVILYLQAPVTFLRQRIETRGREFEVENYSTAYLTGLHESLELVVGNLEALGQSVIKLDVTKTNFIENQDKLEVLIKEII